MGFWPAGTWKCLQKAVCKYVATSLERQPVDQRSHLSCIANIRLPRWFAHECLILLSLAVLAFLIYSNTFESPFVFDDKQNIQNNPDIRLTRLTWDNVTRAAFPNRVSHRPISEIQHMVWPDIPALRHGAALKMRNGWWCLRQGKIEDWPLSLFRLHPDLSTVVAHNPINNCES